MGLGLSEFMYVFSYFLIASVYSNVIFRWKCGHGDAVWNLQSNLVSLVWQDLQVVGCATRLAAAAPPKAATQELAESESKEMEIKECFESTASSSLSPTFSPSSQPQLLELRPLVVWAGEGLTTSASTQKT